MVWRLWLACDWGVFPVLVIAESADLKVKRFGDISGCKITEAIEIEGLESCLTSYSLHSVRTRCLQADSVHVFQKGIGKFRWAGTYIFEKIKQASTHI